MSRPVTVALEARATLGEGPLWDAEQERLYWLDVFDGRVFRATASGHEIRCWDMPQKVGAMALCKDGHSAVVALARGFHLLDFKCLFFRRQVTMNNARPARTRHCNGSATFGHFVHCR